MCRGLDGNPLCADAAPEISAAAATTAHILSHLPIISLPCSLLIMI
jgi:hypothetical protein